MKKCLIVCPGSSVWSYNFIRHMAGRYEITLFSIMPYDDEYRKKYSDLGVRFVENEDLLFPLSNVFAKAKFLIKVILKYNRLRDHDFINIQWGDPVYMLACLLVPGNARKTVVSYWGSDLYQIEPRLLKLVRRRINKIAYATFDNIDLMYQFDKVYPGNKVSKRPILLPLPVLDVIEDMRSHKDEGNTYVVDGIRMPRDKTIVCVGYNGRPEQQHIPVLNAIDKLDQAVKDKLFIIISATYQAEEEYVAKIEECINCIGIDYVILRNFLNDVEISKLRLITDIYINAQTTDAFSGSVCEFLFADTLLINAKWLRYSEFDKYGFSFYEFEDFEEIPGIIAKAISEPSVINHAHNREMVYKLRGVNGCMPQWFELFDGI